MILFTPKSVSVMKNFFIIVFVFALQSCVFLPIWEDFVCLGVENNSNDSLLVYLALDQPPRNPTVYPDTCLPKDIYVGFINLPHTNDSLSGYLVGIPPREQMAVECTIINTDYWGNGKLDKFFDKLIRVKVLSFFFISADTLNKYGYDYVASHNMIQARYDLTESDMRHLDMMIPYPPTESMKGMKIWMPDAISNQTQYLLRNNFIKPVK